MNSSVPNSSGPAGLVESLSSLSFTAKDFVLYGILTAVLPVLYTFIVTTLNNGKPTKDGEPPVPPYAIPFVGHAIAMMSGQLKLIEKVRTETGRPGQPRTLYVFGQKIYLISDPVAISTMWRKTKTVAFGPLQSYTYRQLFGGTERAARLIDVGLPGVDQTGIEDKIPVMKHIHEYYHRELGSGSEGLEHMTRMFQKELHKELSSNTSNEFTEVNLFAWIKKVMFPASGRALHGYKLRITPELAANFWKWDGAFLEIAKMYPDFLIPGVREARMEVIKEFIRWREEVIGTLDGISDDVAWEENFGCRLVRKRVKLMEQALDPDDIMGIATIHLSFFWGLEANAIPAACWVVANTLFHPEVFEGVKRDVEQCIDPLVEGSGLPTFNIEKLLQMPYLNAVWQESKRLGISSLSPRIVIEDTEIEGYMYKKGGMIQGLGNILQIEEEYWGKDVKEFKPERWLPLPGETPAAAGKRIRELNTKLRPFGGGASICPGRYFAEQEMLSCLAVLVTSFEWDVQGQQLPKANDAKFGAGGLPPVTDVKVKVRRRY